MLICIAGKIVNFLPTGLARRLVNLITKGEKFFSIDQIYEPFTKRVCTRLILELPGYGCTWYKSSGGCTMCGFGRKIEEVNTKWNLSADDLVGVYKIAAALSKTSRPEWLYIYNGGSFLNPEEIPYETQKAIYGAIRKSPTIYGLFIESRPEYIQEEALVLLKKTLGDRSLEVGIGLEAVSDKVREIYIHKGFSLKSYERAVKLLKSYKMRVLTYVFLKPPNLSEREAIEEAIKTTIYAFERGSDEVSLSCAFVQEGTLLAKLYSESRYRPPWLWSIIEVVSRTIHLGPLRIGSFEDTPPPIAIPHNCGKCDNEVMRAIKRYNLTHDLDVFKNLDCECKKEWKNISSN